MLQEMIKVTGKLNIQLFDKSGALKDSRNVDNLVVAAGKEFIAAAWSEHLPEMSHMAVGADNTAPAAGNTALGSELARVALSSDTAASNVVTYVATFGPGVGTGAIVEAGIFNAASSGTMLCRTVFSVVNKGADDAMTITWQITVS